MLFGSNMSDVISLVIENQDDSTVLIQVDSDIQKLPHQKTSKEPWIQSANSFLNQVAFSQFQKIALFLFIRKKLIYDYFISG